MKKKTLGFVHTSATLVPVFAELCKEYIPEVNVFNIVDDSLIKNTIACGELTKETSRRVVGYAHAAEQAGADLILFTCSSIGPAVETAATLVNTPVWRVDQAMAEKAVMQSSKIGVIATLSTTLAPTAKLVKDNAAKWSKEIRLVEVLCKGAFEALMSGDGATHDQIVGDALATLADQVDVIILAQASMARVVDTRKDVTNKVTVLASPPNAMEAIRSFFSTLD